MHKDYNPINIYIYIHKCLYIDTNTNKIDKQLYAFLTSVKKHLGHQPEANAQPFFSKLQPKVHMILTEKNIATDNKLTFQNYKMYKEMICLMQE